MSIDFLFADFDRLIQSSESVHRLRRFILDLAVRGKLAPQDPNDEPASELLKRIELKRGESINENWEDHRNRSQSKPILTCLTTGTRTFGCFGRLGNRNWLSKERTGRTEETLLFLEGYVI